MKRKHRSTLEQKIDRIIAEVKARAFFSEQSAYVFATLRRVLRKALKT